MSDSIIYQKDNESVTTVSAEINMLTDTICTLSSLAENISSEVDSLYQKLDKKDKKIMKLKNRLQII
jgi:peptidoglycan hydrolase CwlO-like protein